MEIIYKTTEKKSNFTYCAELFKNKKPLNGFNKMFERIMWEPVDDDEFEVQNVYFDEPIDGVLYLDYPFQVVVKENIHFDSLYSLISEIRRVYKAIYEDEEKTMKKIVKKNPNIINRGVSDGKYGI